HIRGGLRRCEERVLAGARSRQQPGWMGPSWVLDGGGKPAADERVGEPVLGKRGDTAVQLRRLQCERVPEYRQCNDAVQLGSLGWRSVLHIVFARVEYAFAAD